MASQELALLTFNLTCHSLLGKTPIFPLFKLLSLEPFYYPLKNHFGSLLYKTTAVIYEYLWQAWCLPLAGRPFQPSLMFPRVVNLKGASLG